MSIVNLITFKKKIILIEMATPTNESCWAIAGNHTYNGCCPNVPVFVDLYAAEHRGIMPGIVLFKGSPSELPYLSQAISILAVSRNCGETMSSPISFSFR